MNSIMMSALISAAGPDLTDEQRETMLIAATDARASIRRLLEGIRADRQKADRQKSAA